MSDCTCAKPTHGGRGSCTACSGFACEYADAGRTRCPEWRCDCFIETYPDSPFALHPEAFVVGPLADPETGVDDQDHGPDCVCPGTCSEWILTNAGLGFNEDGTPRLGAPGATRGEGERDE